jgi:hypothetical protein
MKIKLIALLAFFAVGCATAPNKEFSRKEVLNDFDQAWDSYWTNNKKRSWKNKAPKIDRKEASLKVPNLKK